jgi:hypothetical protein
VSVFQKWIEANVLEVEFPLHAFDVWHDRAVFHFPQFRDGERHPVDQEERAGRPGCRQDLISFELPQDVWSEPLGYLYSRLCPFGFQPVVNRGHVGGAHPVPPELSQTIPAIGGKRFRRRLTLE